MIKAKNDQIKKRKHEIYEICRNKIVEFLRVSRKFHCTKYFDENKKSSRAIMQVIYDIVYSKQSKEINTFGSLLIDGKTIANPKDMTKNFNNFFTSIGRKFQSNIPPTKKHYIDYLKHTNPETFLYHRQYPMKLRT